jgi:pimeloyl-ACP methyl ester carboxylesterase
MPRLTILAALAFLLLPALPVRGQPAWSAALLGIARPAPALATAFAWHYPGAVPHAAFAFVQDAAGHAAWGFSSGAADLATATAAALADCTTEAATQGIAGTCRVAARDATLGDAGPVAPLHPPLVGALRAAPLLRFLGPAAARGVVIWGHGSAGPRGTDLRATATPGLVSVLNRDGWDVLRFDRAPGEDALDAVVPRLLAAVAAARAAGYARVVLGGHSRGGWISLLAAAAQPASVNAVIALSPASWGRVAAGNGRAQEAMAAYDAALAKLAPSAVRLAVALFDGDPYDPGPAERAAMLAALDADRAAPALALWPRDVGGHGGGEDWRFTRAMAPCLRDWLDQREATAPRGLRRDAC